VVVKDPKTSRIVSVIARAIISRKKSIKYKNHLGAEIMIMLGRHRERIIKRLNRPTVVVQLEDPVHGPFEADVYIDELTSEERARVHSDDLHLLQKHQEQQSWSAF